MTDVLGTCTAWGDGVCVVAPEAGPPVEIAIADIVSGKPVPPRPSVRHRISPADAEAHVAALWPHLETQPLGGWTLRTDPAPEGRLRRRANSCLAMGDPGMPVAEADDAIRAFYDARNRPRWVQVELGSEHELALRDLGWAPFGSGDAHFQIAPVARALRACDAGLRRLPRGQDAAGAAMTPRYQEIGDQVRVTLGDGLATGDATYADDWLGLHGVEVDPAHRRRGLAHAVIAALLDWGAERGATTAWLHVETVNAPAITLYERLGFVTHHTCRYLALD
jgi:ribosomal protein S18 acetylase RimI-like enzyme